MDVLENYGWIAMILVDMLTVYAYPAVIVSKWWGISAFSKSVTVFSPLSRPTVILYLILILPAAAILAVRTSFENLWVFIALEHPLMAVIVCLQTVFATTFLKKLEMPAE